MHVLCVAEGHLFGHGQSHITKVLQKQVLLLCMKTGTKSDQSSGAKIRASGVPASVTHPGIAFAHAAANRMPVQPL